MALVLVLLSSAYPFLRGSEHRGSAEFHATIEMVGAIIGLLAGTGFVIRFYSLGHRFHLLVGLAFFINGVEDFVHGFLGFASSHGWIELPDSVVRHSIPVTYVSCRLLMASLLILAPFLPKWLGEPRNPKRETVWVSLIVLLITAAGTLAAFLVPLPELVFPSQFNWV